MSLLDNRRCGCRRQQQRRDNPVAFNSPEWLAQVSVYFHSGPRVDRREAERRLRERRCLERRFIRRDQLSTVFQRVRIPPVLGCLSDEERLLIQQLFEEDSESC